MIEKVIRDGKVAVLYSPGFGAGWSTWNYSNQEILLFSPKVVEMVEAGRRTEIDDEWCLEHLGIDIYTGGSSNLTIEWIQQGEKFTIEEYDGSESIRSIDDLSITA